jgi:hypothetical protein
MPDVLTNVPIPDPSALTTEQLHRELASLKAQIEIRLDGMDKASQLLAANVSRVPTDTDKQIDHLRGLHSEKFASVQSQFRDLATLAAASEKAATTAVNAALQAAKEAVASQNTANSAAITKSEAATADQIKGILAHLASNTKATDEKIADINRRLDRGEGVGSGRASSQATLLAVGAVIVSMIVGAFSIVSGMERLPAQPAAAAIDSKRVDDLVARVDSLARHIDTIEPKK